jgi:glycosyltransferase involved in cell wall biosynthesis
MKKMKKKAIKTCIVAMSFEKAFSTPLTNLKNILVKISTNVDVIAGSEKQFIYNDENFDLHYIPYKSSGKFFNKLINYLTLEIKTSIELFKIAPLDYCIFFSQNGSILPFLSSKLLNKNTLWLLPSYNKEMQNYTGDKLAIFSIIISRLCISLVDKLLIYSSSLKELWNLANHENKILIYNEHFLNFNLFQENIDFNDRDNIVGFIGRLSKEKGVLNFIEAITILSNSDANLKYLLIGSGPLKEQIEILSKENELNNLEMIDWIEYDDIPTFINRLKIIVIPSYTEGLPNVLLESMACGTPVLATPVGTIPEIIKDGETGFILQDNSPETIANNIMRVLNTSNLKKITENAHLLVEERFNYENVVKMWKNLIK